MVKKIVVPGEKIDAKVSYNAYLDPNTKENRSMIFGILLTQNDYGKIVPLKGKYFPSKDDFVIGLVLEVKYGGYVLDLNSPYTAYLPSQREYEVGDLVFAKVIDVNEVKSVLLADDKQLHSGSLVEISPTKIARVIGKKNSMITMLKEKTNCIIFVGKNGRVWVKGDKAYLVEEAVREIEKEAHSVGLTDKISKLLEK